MKYETLDKVYVCDSGIKGAGRGVFARKKIEKGEEIERCPVIELGIDEVEMIEKSVLVNYVFWIDDGSIIVLGYGAIYNHSEDANARYVWDRESRVMRFVASEEILKDQEIKIDYLQDKKERGILWFEVE